MKSKFIKFVVIFFILLNIPLFSFPNYFLSFAKKQQATIQLKADLNMIIVNGLPMPIDMAPEIKFGKMFISIRTLTNEVWMVTLDWDPVARKVTINSRYSTIVFWIGKSIANIDGEPKQIDSDPKIVPYIKNGRSMLPIRFITDNLRAKSLSYDAKSKTATVVLEWFPNDLFCDWPTKGGNTQKQYWVPTAFELKSNTAILKKETFQKNLSETLFGSPLLVACDGLAYFNSNEYIFVYDPLTNRISLLKTMDIQFQLHDIILYEDKIICSSPYGVMCLDRFSGKENWKNVDKNKIVPETYGSEVSFGKLIQISRSEIRCYNLNDGVLAYKINASDQCGNCKTPFFGKDYVIDEKLLWVIHYDSVPDVFSNTVICININEGKVVWRKGFKNYVLIKTFIDSKVIISEYNAGLKALDAWTGKEIWSNNIIVNIPAVDEAVKEVLLYNTYNYMAVFDQRLICQDENNLFCLDNTNGKVIWNVKKNHECNINLEKTINTFSFLVDSKRIYAYEKDGTKDFYIGSCPSITNDKIRVYDINSGILLNEIIITEVKKQATFINVVIHKRKIYVLYTDDNSNYIIKLYESK